MEWRLVRLVLGLVKRKSKPDWYSNLITSTINEYLIGDETSFDSIK